VPSNHPAYTDEFRQQAVDLLLSSDRPLKKVAEDLGVSADAAADGPQDASEMRRLRRENEYLRRQRDILKKAMSILGEDPQLGMR